MIILAASQFLARVFWRFGERVGADINTDNDGNKSSCFDLRYEDDLIQAFKFKRSFANRLASSATC